MILENDQNNILEAKIMIFVVLSFCENVILSVKLNNKPPVCMQAFVSPQIP